MCTRITFRPVLQFPNGKRKVSFRYRNDVLDTTKPDFSLSDCLAECKSIIGQSFRGAEIVDVVPMPCGKCPDCLRARSESWACRLVCELQSGWQSKAFITLTYDELNYPARGLDKKQVQRFLKRLRKQINCRFKYFLCGEYGGRTLRGHYHAILFADCPDEVLRQAVSRCWPYGFKDYDSDVNFKNCAYTARYVDKKIEDNLSKKVYEKMKLTPPFLLVSQHLGADYALRHLDFFDNFGYVQCADGRRSSVPKYFQKLLEDNGFHHLEASKEARLNQSLNDVVYYANSFGLSFAEAMQVRERQQKDKKRRLQRL